MNSAAALLNIDSETIALIVDDDQITYGELADAIDAARASLVAGGLKPGDRAALIAGNELDFAIGALAALGAGAIVSPQIWTSPWPEVKRKLDAFKPDLVMIGASGAWVSAHAEALDAPLADLRALAPAPPTPIVALSADAVAYAMPTSGITGQPKIAQVTHGNVAWAVEAVGRNRAGGDGADVLLGVLPFSHIYGLVAVLHGALALGSTVVLQNRFEATASLDLIEQHGVTIMAGAPPMWRALSRAAAGRPQAAATVRRAISGAAALPASVHTAVKETMGLTVRQGYGLTETTSMLSVDLSDDVRSASVGRPLDGVEVVVVDDAGVPVPPGDAGEIVVRSPSVFAGYLDAPELTEAVLTKDGWFWTGDVGVFDTDGFLHIVDRATDIIIVSGFNVYPAEVESVLTNHPDITGAVVTGKDDRDSGEAVVAYLTTSAPVTTEAIASFARARLNEYKCPIDYHLVDELPIAPTGKKMRRKLRLASSPGEKATTS